MKLRDHIGTIAITLVILFILAVWFASEESGDSSKSPSAVSIEKSAPDRRSLPSLDVKWAHSTVNIRAGRGTDYPVVMRLQRGESIRVDSLYNGWYRAWRYGKPIGYVAASVLHDRPLPAVEIVSWDWYIERKWQLVTWVAQVRNNTRRYIEIVQLEFTTFDARGNILDTDVGFAQSIPPGGTASVKGLATYRGGEHKARLRVVDFY